MDELSEQTSAQFSEIATYLSFFQPVGVNLVSFAQQTREGNYFFKKMSFFVGERD